MKNIHLIPTDKPSRLIHNDANQLCYQSNKSFKNDRKWMYRKKFNIYITSDEEIKEGDWYFDGTDLVHKKTKYNDALVYGNKDAKKIILTTDQDLIKDGVQAIDDEFLEWFVKNPNCEEVEVEDYNSYGVDNWKYLITIPKEEPKQHYEDVHEDNVEKWRNKPKQETTPEEVAEYLGFVKGVKWQQERSYSEEEVLELLLKMNEWPTTFDGEEDVKEWFEQIKKK